MLLEVAKLTIDLATPGGPERVVNGATFALDEGESFSASMKRRCARCAATGSR